MVEDVSETSGLEASELKNVKFNGKINLSVMESMQSEDPVIGGKMNPRM